MQAGQIRQRLTPILFSLCFVLFTVKTLHARIPGELVQLFNPFPRHFNSALTSNLSVTAVGADVFTFLVELDALGDVQPLLAESWNYSEDGLTLTFRLRMYTIFHDGMPVTAHDALFSYATFRKNHPLGEKLFEKVVDAEIPDEQTLIFRLSAPDPALLRSLAAPFMPILPKHIYDTEDIRSNPANQHPVGSGPFRVVRFKPGETFTLEKFNAYLKPGLPLLDRIIGLNGENYLYAVSVLKDGTAHLFNFVEHPDILNLVSGSEIFAVSTDGYGSLGAVTYLEFNLRKTPLNQTAVRQAIAHAIDRAALGTVLYGDRSRVLDGPLQPGSRFYQPGTAPYVPDLELAKNLLNEAGLPREADGIRFETHLTWLPDQSGAAERTAAIIKAQLARIGIRLILDKPQDDVSPWLQLAKWQHHMILSRIQTWDDPAIRLQRMFSSKYTAHRFGANTSGFRDDQADVLLETAAGETNPEIRYQLYGQFQDLVREELPLYFMHVVPYTTIINRDLEIPESGRGILGLMDKVTWKTSTINQAGEKDTADNRDSADTRDSSFFGTSTVSN